jgi:hypothetical protein
MEPTYSMKTANSEFGSGLKGSHGDGFNFSLSPNAYPHGKPLNMITH